MTCGTAASFVPSGEAKQPAVAETIQRTTLWPVGGLLALAEFQSAMVPSYVDVGGCIDVGKFMKDSL